MQIIEQTPTLLKLGNRRYFNSRFWLVLVSLIPPLFIIGTLYFTNAKKYLEAYILLFFPFLATAILCMSLLFQKENSACLLNKKTNKLYLTISNTFKSVIESYPLDDIKEISVLKEFDSDGDPYYQVQLILKSEKIFCLRTGYNTRSHYALAQAINDFLENPDQSESYSD
ncbi:MAG: hypothetical protein F6K42_16290 [Leptolyngbya sp. SIO1D8]|nr:hypothetical protein [Leptolyngbya sp. SIO1D8]